MTRSNEEIKEKMKKIIQDLQDEDNPLYFIYGAGNLHALAWVLRENEK